MSANIDVGIKTSGAKESLRELKSWMAQEMAGMVLSVNETSLTNSVKAALKRSRFEIPLQPGQLESDVSRMLQQPFNIRRRVLIDGADLSAQVREGVMQGLAGLKVPSITVAPAVPAVAPATRTQPAPAAAPSNLPTGVAEMKAMIAQVVAPMLDEVAKVTQLTAKEASGPRGTRASVRYSTRDLNTGATISVTEPAPWTAEETKRQVIAGYSAERHQRVTDQAVKRDVAFENPGATEAQRLTSQVRKLRVAQAYVSAGREDLALDHLGPKAMEQISGLSALQAKLDALKGTTTNLAQAERELRREMANVYQSARTAASDTYTGRGARAVGAKALVDQYGEDYTRAYLNNDRVVGDIPRIDSYRKKTPGTPAQVQATAAAGAASVKMAQEQSARDKAWGQLDKQVKLDRDAAWLAAERELQASRGQLEVQHTNLVRREAQQRVLVNKTAADQIKSYEATLAESVKAKAAGTKQAFSYGPDRTVKDAAEAQARKERELTQKRSISNLVSSTKTQAALDGYDSRGQALKAYSAVKTQFGQEKADVVFNSQWLADNVNNLEQFRRKAKSSADDAVRSMRQAMQEAQNSAKFTLEGVAAADGKPKYTARGRSVAGAAAVVQRSRQEGWGDAQAAKFINNSALFEQGKAVVDGTRSMDEYVRKMREAGQVHADGGIKAKDHAAAMRGWSAAAADAHSAARGLAGSLGMLWTTWGNTAPIVAAAAIGASLRGVYEEGKRVEYQLAFVKGLSGQSLTTGDVEGAARGSLFGSKEATDGLRALTQSGLNAKEAIAALPDVLALATVGETDAATAAYAATGVYKAYGMSIADIGRVSDVMAKAAASSNASVTDMMEAFKYASSSSQLYGESLEETGAALAMLSEKNIKGSMAGTAHMNMLREIYTPTRKAAQAFKELGVDIQGMQREGLSSVEILDKIREKTSQLDSTSRRQFASVVGGERGNRELAPLLEGGTKSMKDFQRELQDSSGFTKQVMSELMNTVEGSQARIKQALSSTFTEAFDEAKGPIQAFNNSLAGALSSESFKSFITETSQGVIALTRFLVEHGDAVKTVTMLYVGMKVVGGVVSSINGLAFSLAGSAASLQANIAQQPRFIQSLLVQTGVVSQAAVAEARLTATLAERAVAQGAASGAASAGAVATATVTAATNAQAVAAGGAAAVLTRATTATGALASMTRLALGPLGLILTVGTSLYTVWELVANKQDRVKDSMDAMRSSYETTLQLLDQEIDRLERAKYLRENPGKSEGQAQIDGRISGKEAEYASLKAAQRGILVGSTKPTDRVNVINERMEVEVLSAKDALVRANAKMPELEKEIGTLKARKQKVDAMTASNDNANASKAMLELVEQMKGQVIGRAPKGAKPENYPPEIKKALQTLDAEVTPEALSKLKSTRDVDARRKSLQVVADTGGQRQAFGETSARGGNGNGIEHRDAMASLRYRKSVYDEQAKFEDAEFSSEETKLKSREQSKLITQEGFYIRQEVLMKEHLTKRKEIAEAERNEIETALKSSLTVSPKVLRQKLDEGTKEGREPSKVVEQYRTKDAKLQAGDILSTLSDLNKAEGEVRQLAEKIDGAVSATAFRIEGKLKEATQKRNETLMALAQKDVRELSKIAAETGELKIGSNQPAGPQAMQSLYPQRYVSFLSAPGMTEAQKAALAQERDDKQRQNFENRQRRQYASVGLKGRGAQDTSLKAAMSAYDDYAPEIDKVSRAIATTTAELATQKAAWISVRDAEEGVGSNEVMSRYAEVESLTNEITALQNQKLTLEQMLNVSADTRSASATQKYKEQRTPEYGMKQFWEKYTQDAGDSAKLVDNVLSQSFASAEQALTQFTTTGKVNFASLTRSILADAAKMMANAAMKQLIGMGINALVGYAGSGSSTQGQGINYDQADFAYGGIMTDRGAMSLTRYAHGGIMTDRGEMQLRKYAAGGIARNAQLAMFGESTMAEAYVPLPDGRSIPVTINAEGSGGGGGGVVVNMNISISGDGNSKVANDSSGQSAASLGKLIEQAVVTTIVKEQRPGGLLYK